MTDPDDRPAAPSSWWRRIGSPLASSWRRVVSALQGSEPADQQLKQRWAITPIAVPARGYAFNFQVHPTFTWTSEGVGRTTFRSLVETFQPHARARLTRLAGGLARGVEPHRGEDFEGRLQRRLDDTGDWTFEWNGRRIACQVHVRVEPDERLREHLRSYWERLVALDYERDIAARRARHTDAVSAQWSAVLKRILDSSEPTGAATMTNEKLATVIREILADRRAWDEAMDGLEAQDEFARDGFFDPLGEDNRRRPFA
jgi:hypothetical protein